MRVRRVLMVRCCKVAARRHRDRSSSPTMAMPSDSLTILRLLAATECHEQSERVDSMYRQSLGHVYRGGHCDAITEQVSCIQFLSPNMENS